MPVCMAKTQYSFSADPTLKSGASGFTLNIREVRLAAGAGFVVALCGEIHDHARPAAPPGGGGDFPRCGWGDRRAFLEEGKGRKRFFFEKKKQKTSIYLADCL